MTGVDPGRDNVAGTADDGMVQVWSVPRSYPTFGQISELTVNAAPGEGDDRYTAFERRSARAIRIDGRCWRRTALDRRDVKNITPRNPNEAAYNWELPESYQGVRLSGTYELPWRMLLASTFTAQEGEYFNRIVQVRDALNTT